MAESARPPSIAWTVLRLIGKGLMRIVVVLSVLVKATSGQANGFMEMPTRPAVRQRDYRP